MEAIIDSEVRYYFDDGADAGALSHYGFFGGFRLCPEMLRKTCSGSQEDARGQRAVKLETIAAELNIGGGSQSSVEGASGDAGSST